MQDDPPKDWLEAELQDTLDEDYEIELEDAVLSQEIARIYRDTHPEQMPRADYFRELLRLQSELIRLQDWVAYHKEKVVVLFEGRDSAGKGGAIKRITQRLNPRVARVVALPAPSDREKTQWYFQRYVPHLPAGVRKCSGTMMPWSNFHSSAKATSTVCMTSVIRRRDSSALPGMRWRSMPSQAGSSIGPS